MPTALGVQTYFSFHWGTASPAAWFARAEALGYSYLGIADHASLCGLPEIVKAAAKSRVKPLYGVSFPLANGNAVIAYVENKNGYGTLCQLVTDWFLARAPHPELRAGGIPALPAATVQRLFRERDDINGIVFITNEPEIWSALRTAGVEAYWRIGPTLAAPPRDIDPTLALFAPGSFLLSRDDFIRWRCSRTP